MVKRMVFGLAALPLLAFAGVAEDTAEAIRSLVLASAKGWAAPDVAGMPGVKAWLETNGESVLQTKPGRAHAGSDMLLTYRDDYVYVHAFDRRQKIAAFRLDGYNVEETKYLMSGRPAIYERTRTGAIVIWLEWPPEGDVYDLVIRLKVSGRRLQRLSYAVHRTVPCVYTNSAGAAFRYRLHEPKGLSAGEKAPLVVFLHGAGERGSDNKMQMVHGVPQILKYAEDRNMPIFLVAGQVPGGKNAEYPEGRKWVQVLWKHESDFVEPMPKEPSSSMLSLIEVVDALRRDPRVDVSRVYVTGVSMGGYGTWDLILRKPEWFAAAMPLCAGVDLEQVWRARGFPIWIMHGGSDNTVPFMRGRHSFEASRKAGLDVRYTEYPGIGHDVWEIVYNDDKALDWLFAQKRAKVAD